MTLDEAYALFAKYGNVCSDPMRLKSTKPTIGQLKVAAEYINLRHIDKELVDEAYNLIAKDCKLEENND